MTILTTEISQNDVKEECRDSLLEFLALSARVLIKEALQLEVVERFSHILLKSF